MKIGMLFPGYGSQFVGMGKELYDESRVMQEYFEEAFNCLNVNFVKLCFASSDAELSKMSNAYVAIFLVSSALQALLKEEGINADIVAGYNLGEYAALHAAGGISFPDGLYLLNKYANFYQEALVGLDAGVMRVQGISIKELAALCKKISSDDEHKVAIAIYNGDADNVISGHTTALDQLRSQLANEDQVTCTDLPIEVGLHSDLMNPVKQALAIYLEKVDFKGLNMPLICTTDVCFLETGEQVRARIVEHIDTPVKWTKVIDELNDCDIIVEVGPGSALSTMAKEKYPDKMIVSINKRSDVQDLKKILEPQS